jgi:hypothetical protein
MNTVYTYSIIYYLKSNRITWSIVHIMSCDKMSKMAVIRRRSQTDRQAGLHGSYSWTYLNQLILRIRWFIPACLPATLLACLSACLPANLPACLQTCLSVCLLACLPTCKHACLSICLSVCLSWYTVKPALPVTSNYLCLTFTLRPAQLILLYNLTLWNIFNDLVTDKLLFHLFS